MHEKAQRAKPILSGYHDDAMEKHHDWLPRIGVEIRRGVDIQYQAVLVPNKIAGEDVSELRTHISERGSVPNAAPLGRGSRWPPAQVANRRSSEGNATESADITFDYTLNQTRFRRNDNAGVLGCCNTRKGQRE